MQITSRLPNSTRWHILETSSRDTNPKRAAYTTTARLTDGPALQECYSTPIEIRKLATIDCISTYLRGHLLSQIPILPSVIHREHCTTAPATAHHGPSKRTTTILRTRRDPHSPFCAYPRTSSSAHECFCTTPACAAVTRTTRITIGLLTPPIAFLGRNSRGKMAEWHTASQCLSLCTFRRIAGFS